MNKTFLYAVALLACVTACSVKELDVPSREGMVEDGQELTFTANLEKDVYPTKATIAWEEEDDGDETTPPFHFEWTPSDQINVFYGANSGVGGSIFTSDGNTTGTSTQFSGTLNVFSGTIGGDPESVHFWATYPYNSANVCDGESVTVTLPAVQRPVASSFDPASYLMVARSRGLDLYFKIVNSGLRFCVSREDIVKVVLQGHHNETLAGKAKIVYDQQGAPVVSEIVPDGSESETITAFPAVGNAFVPGQWYFVNCYPAEMEDGFTFTYYNEDGFPGSYKVNTSYARFERKAYNRLNNRDLNVRFTVPNNQIWFRISEGASIPEFESYTITDGTDGWLILSKSDGCDITDIPADMFKDQTALTEVLLPPGITSIGSSAFEGCASITTLSIPDAVSTINSRTFYGCTSLETLSLPQEWSASGSSIFSNCTALRYVTGGNTSLDGHAIVINNELYYAACAGLTDYTFPDEITKIGQSAFLGNTSLTALTIPDGVKEIGTSAFRSMSALKSLVLPSTVEKIDGTIVLGCTALNEIYLKAITPPELSSTAFDIYPRVQGGCSIYVPYHSLADYTDAALNRNWELYVGRIKAKTTTIDYQTVSMSILELPVPSAFGGAEIVAHTYENGHGNVVFADEVTSITAGAFSNCPDLSIITIPESVQSIERAFEQDANLKAFNGKFATADHNALINDKGEMIAFAPKDLTFYRVPEEVTAILPGVFKGTQLESVVLPSSLKKIEVELFYGCTHLKTLDIPSGVAVLRTSAFQGCSGLMEIHFHSTEPPIAGNYVFEGLGSSSRMVVPDSSLQAYKDEFGRATSRYRSMVSPESAVIYYRTSDHQELELPQNVVLKDLNNQNYTLLVSGYDPHRDYGLFVVSSSFDNIMPNFFYDKTTLVSVEIPSTVRRLGEDSFYNTGLTSIEFPSMLSADEGNWVLSRAFRKCTNLARIGGPYASEDGRCLVMNGALRMFLPGDLTTYTFPSNVTTIRDYVIPPEMNANNLTSLFIPEGVVYIGSAFYNCPSLKKISFPETLLEIGGSAFFGAPLESLSFPAGLRRIGNYAFQNCSSLTYVSIRSETPFILGDRAFNNIPSGGTNVSIYVPYGKGDTFRNSTNGWWSNYAEHIFDGGNQIEFTTVTSYANVDAFKASALGTKLVNESQGDGPVLDITYTPSTRTGTVKFKSTIDKMPGFFRGSTDVSSLTLPNEIYIFTEAPFQGMTNLSTIYSTYATSDHRSIVTLNNDLAGFAPSGLTSYTVPSGVKCILEEVFKDASLTTVSLPDGLKSIRASAFEGANITSVVLPGTLTDLKKNAFLDCFNLASIQIGSYLEVIPVGAFKNCSNLQTIEFSTYSRVKDIQSEAFMNCENLSSIVGPTSSVKTIGPNAFSNSGITSINLANVMTLGTEAFSGCEQLADIGTLSADLREIPNGAFYNCPSLTVPEAFTNIRSIGENAFRGDRLPSRMTISSLIESIGAGAFSFCTGLCDLFFSPRSSDNELKLGESVFSYSDFETVMMDGIVVRSTAPINSIYKLSLPAYSFQGCKELISISLPSVEMISHAAFKDCRKLEILRLPATVIALNYQIVTGCDNLRYLYIRYKDELLNIDSEGYGMGIDYDSVLGMENFTQDYSIFVPANLYNRYREAVVWNNMKDHMKAWIF